jgi:hypothetical protein
MRMALMRGVSLVGFGVQSLGGHGLIRMMMRLQPRVRSMSLANWLGAEQSTDWGNWLRWIGDHEVARSVGQLEPQDVGLRVLLPLSVALAQHTNTHAGRTRTGARALPG